MSKQVLGPRGFRDEAIRAKTGKSSLEWYTILDTWGATTRGHTATAKHLRDLHGLSPWWAQAVTNRYEWERGVRKEQRTT
jgi:hypothetical protein